MTLIDRALAAAASHESHHEPAFDRANQCARNLHALLNPATQHDPNQAPSQVITERDWHRFEPGTARPGLLVTYTENEVADSFIPNHTDADFLLLGPCPANCGGTVPRAAIFELCDLGHYLNHGDLTGPPEPFTGDPGHRIGCPHG